MSIQNQDVINAFKKHPIGFSCGLLALSLIAVSYFRSSTVTELETQLQARTDEGQRLDANVKNGAGLGDQIATLQGAIAAVDARAIDPLALAVNLQYFYELEAALQVRLIDLRQGTVARPAAGASYSVVPYTVAIEGRYEQVLRFLQHLEHGERLVRFNTVSLTPKREGAASADVEPILTLSLSLELLGRTTT